MKSFYDFYTKLQKINEENEELNPKVVDSDPQKPNNDINMDMSKGDLNPKDTPLLTDKSKENGDDDKFGDNDNHHDSQNQETQN